MMSHHGQTHEFDDRSISGPFELLIETLTGTTFEIKASPNDTILSIKSKIQSVEGIPITQQHLLYHLEELNNDTSIGDYSIPNGATLKLVLSMRVGPITMKRFPPVDEAAWRELQELLSDTRKDDLFERLPSGAKLTVLIFHEGEQVNFLKVLENEDGSFSPLSDIGSSYRSLFVGTNPEESEKTQEENAVTMNKVLELTEKLEALSLRKKERKSEESTEVQPSTSQGLRRSDSKGESSKSIRVVSYLKGDSQNPLSSVKVIRKSQKDAQASDAALLRRRLPSYSKVSMAGLSKARKEAENIIQMQSKMNVLVDSESSQGFGLKRPPLPEIRRSPPSDKDKIESQDDKLDDSLREKTTRSFAIVEEENDVSPAPSICSSQSSILALPSSQEVTAAIAISPISREKISATVSRSIFKVSGYLLENDERPKTTQGKVEARKGGKSSVNDGGPLKSPKRTKSIFSKISSLVPITKVINVHMGNEADIDIRQFSRRAAPPKVRNPPVEEDELSKPSEEATVKKRVRCLKCRKKLNITNTYNCRCSGVFCAVHRYSEVHDCPFDYKREGRKMLKKMFPVVASPKLPKI